ncbi:MAG TPA: phosphodiester glycosidase family protein [Pyrinomonadaceae bacterium]
MTGCAASLGLFLVVLLAIAVQPPARTAVAQTSSAPGAEETFQTVAPGVEYQQLVRGHKSDSEATGPWVINMLRVDLTKAKLRMVHAMDEAVGLETVSSMATRYGALAAVNSGYFRTTGTYRGDSIGVGVLKGKLISEPYNNRASMGLIEKPGKQEVVLGHLKFNALLSAGRAAERLVNGFNRPRGENELIVFTPEFHRTTLTNPDGLELVVRRGRVIERRDQEGSSVIPADGFVVSTSGSARQWALDNLLTGARLNLKTALTSVEPEQASLWKQAANIIGGGPQLIKNGRVEITNAAEKILPSFVSDGHPRTAIAKLKSGEILLVTVDGRQPGESIGMSLTMLASLLLEFDAIEAINLDGGGSTTMVIRNKIINKPSDATGERPVSDAILVFARETNHQ